MFIYGFLEANKDLRQVFLELNHFQKIQKFPNFIEILYCCMTRRKKKKFLTIFITRTTLKKEDMGQVHFKKLLKFPKFFEIFHCSMNNK